MLQCLHGFPWLSLVIHPYHLSLLEHLLDYILCSYRAVMCKFLLVSQHWNNREQRPIGEYHMSLSLLLQQCPTCLVHLIWMVLEIRGRWPCICCFMGRYFSKFSSDTKMPGFYDFYRNIIQSKLISLSIFYDQTLQQWKIQDKVWNEKWWEKENFMENQIVRFHFNG